MQRSARWAASGALALMLLGGCAAPQEGPMTTASPEPLPTLSGKTPPIHPTTLPTGPGSPTPPVSTPEPFETVPAPESVLALPAVQAAIAAEAERRGVAEEAVEVVRYDVVTWPDGSIGCPQPGMMYSQALVPGKRLVLAVDGEQASYHASDVGEFAYCAMPTKALPAEADTTR